jgi:hypothetical protein
MPDEEAEEGRRVERAEAWAEGGGRADGVEEAAAGEGGADEGREGGEAHEDLERGRRQRIHWRATIKECIITSNTHPLLQMGQSI